MLNIVGTINRTKVELKRSFWIRWCSDYDAINRTKVELKHVVMRYRAAFTKLSIVPKWN